MALPFLLLMTTLLGLTATTTRTGVCWRSMPLRVASLVLVSVHLVLLGVVLLAPPRVSPASSFSVVTV
jgi:hypothetical protein